MRTPLLVSVLLATLATSASASSFVFTGDYLKVGINDSGGLIDSGFNTGINLDKTGTGTFGPYDFLKPGTPYEFGAVGYNNNSTAYGYYNGNNISGTTTDTSSGSTFSASTIGSYGSLGVEQTTSFSKSGGTIYFDLKLTNTSDVTLNNVVYARGLDPDQDVYAGGGYATSNSIVSNDLVTGSAPITDWTIGIFSNSAYSHTPTIRSSWPYGDPYGLLNPLNDGNGDYSINMAWNIGSLDAGAVADIKFEYRIATTKADVIAPPSSSVPDTASTLALLGAALSGLAFVKRCRR